MFCPKQNLRSFFLHSFVKGKEDGKDVRILCKLPCFTSRKEEIAKGPSWVRFLRWVESLVNEVTRWTLASLTKGLQITG